MAHADVERVCGPENKLKGTWHCRVVSGLRNCDRIIAALRFYVLELDTSIWPRYLKDLLTPVGWLKSTKAS